MSREELKDRLVTNGFDETLADEWLKSIPDEDLERMKEENVVELFKEALAKAEKEEAKQDEPAPEDEEYPVEMKDGMVTCTKCGRKLRVSGGEATPAKEFEVDFEPILVAIKEAVAAQFKEVTIELPDLDARFAALETVLKEVQEEVHRKVEDAAGEMLQDASAATKSRLTFRTRTKEKQPEPEAPTGSGIKTEDGKVFSSVSAMFEEGV